MGRADRVLVKTGAAQRFLVSASLTLPRPDVGAGRLTGSQEGMDDGVPQKHS
jgi:hypothetical protein